MAQTLTIHHTTSKKASENGLAIAVDADANVAVVSMAGVELHRGEPGQKASEALDRALEIVEENGGDDFDIEAYRAEQGDDEGEGEEGGSIVKAKYRERYREFGGDNCGDDFATAWKAATHVPDLNKAGVQRVRQNGLAKTRVDISLARGVLEANGIDFDALGGRNPGHSVMIGLNILRGMPNKGKTVRIGDATFEPSAEWRAAQAEKAQAKADREAKAAQAKTEREAAAAEREAAKAKREADAAAKAEAKASEPKAEAKPEAAAKAGKPSKAQRQAALTLQTTKA